VTDADDPTLPPATPDPVPLGELLSTLSTRRRWQSHLAAGQLQAHWAEVVGPAVAEHTEPVRLKGGMLVLRADSPAWATQVRYLSAELARQVNAALGAEVVTDVHVTGGPLQR
jgi:predicted nucleic acid-binding Zn ribbon protein